MPHLQDGHVSLNNQGPVPRAQCTCGHLTQAGPTKLHSGTSAGTIETGAEFSANGCKPRSGGSHGGSHSCYTKSYCWRIKTEGSRVKRGTETADDRVKWEHPSMPEAFDPGHFRKVTYVGLRRALTIPGTSSLLRTGLSPTSRNQGWLPGR